MTLASIVWDVDPCIGSFRLFGNPLVWTDVGIGIYLCVRNGIAPV